MRVPSIAVALALGLALGTVLPVVASAAPTARARAQLDRIVAVVGDDVILWSELSKATDRHPLLQEAFSQLPANASEELIAQKRRDIESKVLDELIDLALVRAEAERFEITASEQDVDNALPNVAAQYGLTVDELRKQVEASGEYESWAEYRADLKDQIILYQVPRYLATWSVSEAQVREHYRKMTRDESAKVDVEQFVFAAGSSDADARDRAFARAQVVARRLRGTETPTQVAESIGYKEDLSRSVGRGDVAPSVEDALFAAKEGKVVGPLATGQGYVVFKVIGHQASAALSYEEAKERIRRQLEEEAFIKAEQEMRRQLRAKAHIDIRL